MYHLGGKKPFHNQQSSFSRGRIKKEINFLSLFLYLVKSVEFPLDVDDGTLMSVVMTTGVVSRQMIALSLGEGSLCLGQEEVLLTVKVSPEC